MKLTALAKEYMKALVKFDDLAYKSLQTPTFDTFDCRLLQIFFADRHPGIPPGLLRGMVEDCSERMLDSFWLKVLIF